MIGRALIACVLALAPVVAQAQTAPAAPPKSLDDWQFRFTPYAWLMNISGSVTARGQTADVNASFLDLFQKSNSLAAFDGYLEADKGQFGVYLDFVWAKLQFSNSNVSLRNPAAGLQVSAQTSSALSYSMTIVESGGVFEAFKWSGEDSSFTAIDILAGARYWNMSADLSLDVNSQTDLSRVHFDQFDRSRGIAVVSTGTMQWVDPLIGVRVRHQFSPHQEIMVRGDIGGFGIAGASQFTWQALGVYSYSWQFDGYSIAAIGGYRALSLSTAFNSGSLDGAGLNLIMHGPIIGMSVRF